jgi:hypothetical protein
MIRMVDWTLRERLEVLHDDSRIPEIALTVQMWLRACAQQAEKDGAEIAQDVLERLAERLKQGAV